VPLTRDFKLTVQARAKRDPEFRRMLLREAAESFLSGDMETGKLLLRDLVNATVGFSRLGEAVEKSPKSLMRMLGPSGNPNARSLFEIVEFLRKREKMRFRISAA
jgi:hypothetical protein